MLAWTACVCSFSFNGVAQQKSGTLAGKVIGLSGEAISKAPVEAKSLESVQIFKTSSSANGIYSFTDLPVGKYEVSSPVSGLKRNWPTCAPEKPHPSTFATFKSAPVLARSATGM